jgi:hypothetical protein
MDFNLYWYIARTIRFLVWEQQKKTKYTWVSQPNFFNGHETIAFGQIRPCSACESRLIKDDTSALKRKKRV